MNNISLKSGERAGKDLSEKGNAIASDETNSLTVLISGVFHAAFDELAVGFEKKSGIKIRSELSPSVGDSEQSVENRLKRGERADVMIMAGDGMDEVTSKGLVLEGSRVELATAPAGLAMKKGGTKPDISTAEKLKQVLLSASSVAYSISVSGKYVSGELFKKLGIEAEMKGKAHEVHDLVPVGETVAKGQYEYGFQAVSEILPVKGIELVGKLPDPVEFRTQVSAAIPTSSDRPDQARSLLAYLAGPEGRAVLKKHGLELPKT